MAKKRRAKAKPKAKKAVKRTTVKKVKAKKVSRKKPKISRKKPEMNLEKIGEITHYFPHVKAAAMLVLKDSLKAGDNIYIKGHTTDFKESIKSMQLDHVPIAEGRKGQEIGLLVKSRVRIGDSVYRI